MLVEKIHGSHRLQKSRLPGTVAPVLVVKLLRAVDRQSHKPTVVVQETTPLIIKQSAVGLKAILDLHSASVLALKLKRFPVEIQRTHGGLAAMPYKLHMRRRLCLNIQLYIPLKRLLAHQRTLLCGI